MKSLGIHKPSDSHSSSDSPGLSKRYEGAVIASVKNMMYASNLSDVLIVLG